MITGKTLIEWGFDPKGAGAWFGQAIKYANHLHYHNGYNEEQIKAAVALMQPAPVETLGLRTNSLPLNVYLKPESPLEQENLDKVVETMDALLRLPTVTAGVVMPDACPAGTIPVGGVIATKGTIHPGFHSADVCCSMAITVFKRKQDLKQILDAAMAVTHFGPGGRKRGPWTMSKPLVELFEGNRFLKDAVEIGHSNLGTQGDGNHFLYVGTLRSTGQPAIVTHHGSRGVGSLIYKRGLALAKKHTAIVSPRTPESAAWLDADSEDGEAYWRALQIARRWTKRNHFELHNAIQQAIGNAIEDRFWNEHNFVFRRNDGLFYHAKGATPSFKGFSDDDDGRTLIPMNMAEPILITRHTDNEGALGFAPHGAGRNLSRTQHIKNLGAEFGANQILHPTNIAAILGRETHGLDIRAYSGVVDLAELPSAYKSAEQVVRQIEKYRLAEVTDCVDPYGSIMAGEMPWDRKRRDKKEKTGGSGRADQAVA
ncbi:MAG: RtcB family protein [Mesorhizobium sp.]|nr:MAG: RtcB family protein [Mesorhizobium sp.]